ncbi:MULTISPECIES: lycopene cyclase family protein [unclassified Streptomyces]|uniref:lycopene cyclase family protein n=1 Tax=unclassified Streptomyces TaxID=2593676 RepID=UPI002E37CB16|nr:MULTISPECIES: lycopene cyclase family protein [unclassified Streptomyces]WUC68143.1 lycopene cyclase family protein [Streptomyces sp. NBC_00539]
MDEHADVVVIGAGASGLSLAMRLSAAGAWATPRPSVVVLEACPGPLRAPDRTWCFWEEGPGEYEALLTGRWDKLRVTGPDGRAADSELGAWRYKMLRSAPFEAAARRTLADRGCERVQVDVESVRECPGGAEARGHDTDGRPRTFRARWVFDSRPPRPLPPSRSALLQHFKGWFVRTPAPAFDPSYAHLMDFRTAQPPSGLSFAYVLPFSPTEALVEYTRFSPRVLPDAAYDEELRHYCRDVLGLGAFTVTATESGVIPMTDSRFPRGRGRSVVPIGAAGGATRPSTGYTFAAIQRQTRAIDLALRRGHDPVAPAPYGARPLAMDAVLLRALTTGRLDGARFFTDLFRTVPADRLLRFLDGTTSWWEDLLLGLRTPVTPMLLSLLELPLVRRRTHP